MLRIILYILHIFLIKPVYSWCLEEDYVVTHDLFKESDQEYDYVTLSDGKMTIHAGYAWNGCTPRLSVADLFTFGTPNGIIDYKTGKPKAYYASLVHDAIYQYHVIDRKDADNMFKSMLKESDFMPANVYYRAVRMFGARW